MEKIEIKVNGMMCEGCENRIKNALSTIKQIEDIHANHTTGIVTLTIKEKIEIKEIEEIINDIGFEVLK